MLDRWPLHKPPKEKKEIENLLTQKENEYCCENQGLGPLIRSNKLWIGLNGLSNSKTSHGPSRMQELNLLVQQWLGHAKPKQYGPACLSSLAKVMVGGPCLNQLWKKRTSCLNQVLLLYLIP